MLHNDFYLLAQEPGYANDHSGDEPAPDDDTEGPACRIEDSPVRASFAVSPPTRGIYGPVRWAGWSIP